MRFLDGVGRAGLVALLLGMAGTAGAGQVKCRIPFGFTVNERALPAGDYHVSTVGGVLFVRGYGGGALVMTHGLEAEQETEGRLVFRKDGREHVLTHVWMGGVDGHELVQPRDERERVRAARSGGVALEQVVIPAS
jgi:hypothetical protein